MFAWGYGSKLIYKYFNFFPRWSNYEDAIKYLAQVPKYRMQATQIAKDEGMLDKKDKKANRGKSKEQIKVRFLEGNK